MLKTIMTVILIQLYWFSLPFIGYGLLIFAKNYLTRFSNITSFTENILGLPILIKSFFSFIVGVAALSVISVIMYIFRFPAIIFTLSYIFLLIWGTVFLVNLYIRRGIYKKSVEVKLSFNQPKSTILLWAVGIIAVCTLAVDYLISLKFGGTIVMGNDVYVHLSRIITILHEGFSFSDGFLKGLVESRYHLNAIYALYIPPSQILSLLHILPSDVWRWSLAFFRLMQWLAVYNLAYFVFKYWFKKHNIHTWSILATLFAIAMYSGDMYIADYPNHIVVLWIISYVIGMIIFEIHKSYGLLILISSFLLAMTHPTYSMMMALFIVFYCLIRFIINYKRLLKRNVIILYGTSITLLMSTPILTKFYPSHFSNIASLKGVNLIYDNFLPVSTVSWLRPPLLILGIIAAIYMIYSLRKDKTQLVIALSMVLFIPFIIFNPPVLSVLGNFITNNMFYRFSAINVLELLILPIGLATAFSIVKRLKNYFPVIVKRHLNKNYSIYGVSALGLLLLCAMLVVSFRVYEFTFLFERTIESSSGYEYEKINRVHNDLSGVINNRSLVVANLNDSYFLPTALSVYVVAISQSHATPTASIYNRVDCLNAVLTNFNEADFRAVGTDFLVLPPNTTQHYLELADSLPFLTKIAQTQDYIVYKYQSSNRPSTEKPTAACINYRKIEQGN